MPQSLHRQRRTNPLPKRLRQRSRYNMAHGPSSHLVLRRALNGHRISLSTELQVATTAPPREECSPSIHPGHK